MRVIIMRHGEAAFAGPERVLTSRGAEEVKITALKLLSSVNISRILCSPKHRAVQTANVVHSLMHGHHVPEIEVLNELSPMGDASMVYDYISATSEEGTILLVSHIPQVLNLACTFCRPDLEFPSFVTGSALVLTNDTENQSFQPEMFVTPSSEIKLSGVLPFQTHRTPRIAASYGAAVSMMSSRINVFAS